MSDLKKIITTISVSQNLFVITVIDFSVVHIVALLIILDFESSKLLKFIHRLSDRLGPH